MPGRFHSEGVDGLLALAGLSGLRQRSTLMRFARKVGRPESVLAVAASFFEGLFRPIDTMPGVNRENPLLVERPDDNVHVCF